MDEKTSQQHFTQNVQSLYNSRKENILSYLSDHSDTSAAAWNFVVFLSILLNIPYSAAGNCFIVYTATSKENR